MKKFSKILESNNSGKYKVWSYVELVIDSDDEGEASYIADSTLSSIKNLSDYTITKVEKLDFNVDEKVIYESKSKIKSEISGNDYQMVSGIIDILKKVKDVDNRMDIAKDMIEQFKREDIKFDYENFINSVK
jgi:hypothetical protein